MNRQFPLFHLLASLCVPFSLVGCMMGELGPDPRDPGRVRDGAASDAVPSDSATADTVTVDTATPPVDAAMPPADSAASACTGATCETCTAAAACGWCGAAGRCLPGTATGPADGTCGASDWSWTRSQCGGGVSDSGASADTATPPADVPTVPTDAAADPCGAATCGTCTAGASCGWCRSLGRCFTGTSTGPMGGACATSDWAWVSSQCTATATDSGTPPADVVSDPCAASTCGTCTAGASCGWCRTAGRCHTGTSSGPTGGACAMSDWAWTSTQCTAPPVDAGTPRDSGTDSSTTPFCGIAGSCLLCGIIPGCGWCRTTNRCTPGGSSGASDGSCTGGNWIWHLLTC